jgi:hypothetical protein
MKSIIAVLLLASIIVCTNTDKEEKKKTQRELLSNPMFYFFLLGQRNLSESPYCGGDTIGTALGYNNNLTVYPVLEENQELTTNYFNSVVYTYQSSKNTIITITLLDKIKANTSSTIECANKNNRIILSFCSNLKFVDLEFVGNVQVGQIYSKTLSLNEKYFISLSSFENDCNIKVKLRSAT